MSTAGPHENQTFYATTFPAGGVFVNCIFYPSCQFGEGSVFQNCVFIYDYYSSMHIVGANSVFDSCIIAWTIIFPNSTIAKSALIASITLPPSFQSGIRHESGQAHNYHEKHPDGGVIVHEAGTWSFTDICDWDNRLCRDGAIYIPSNAQCADVDLNLIKGHNNF